MAPSIKLTYFDLEGRAEGTRLALVLSGTEFEDERIPFSDWVAIKPTTPFGKLPVMTIDDGPPKTQSEAMLRYVGATFSETLYPSSSLFDIEEAIGLMKDMQDSWGPNLYIAMRPQTFGYPEGYNKTEEGKNLVKSMREAWITKELPTWLGYIESLIDRNGGMWLASSEHPTIADCMAIPILRNFSRGFIDHVPSDTLAPFPKICEYIKRFCALDGIKGRYTDGIY
jgi:glutathione S-transferase|mmetsp:Transcript_20905/g.37971  ORF Transcript_20905/g.37971 Transcript_20905/m.37971 type:complete len:226 (-) Transcript_20905:1479-2156(-)